MEPTPLHAGGMPLPRPRNWLVESILVTIFCCLPFGIAGIVFASQVNSKYDVADYQGALRASRDARRWTLIGLAVGVGWVVIILLFVLASAIFTIPHWH